VANVDCESLWHIRGVYPATVYTAWCDPLFPDINMAVPDLLAFELQNLLDCVEVYGLDYMHGMKKKHYVKRARMALAKYKEQAQ
jgi:hypothetical protein